MSVECCISLTTTECLLHNIWRGNKCEHRISRNKDLILLTVGREPDIPDLLDFMQSNDTTKIIHAASYLQHLCYSDDRVKSKVR